MITSMTDLPSSDDPQSQTAQPMAPQVAPAAPSGNKEVVGGMHLPEGLQDATGHETELPKEVSSSGVRIQPTSIPIPAPVSQMGVQSTGSNIPIHAAPAVALPLNEEQIAAGLRLSVVNSLRWLSEWCVRRIKLMQMKIQGHGDSPVRVKV
jgi:hypothetical protein